MKPKKPGKSGVARIGRSSQQCSELPQPCRDDKNRVIALLVDRGAIAIEFVLHASSRQEIRGLLATINEVEFLMELSRLAIQNLDSEPLGLPGRTMGEHGRIKLVRRLAWLMDTSNLERKPKETRLQALLRHLGRKTDSQLERLVYKLERGKPR